MDDPKTIFKVRASRRTREVWSLTKIVFGLVVLFALFGGLQVAVCKSKNPKKTVVQCLVPLKGKQNDKDKKQR